MAFATPATREEELELHRRLIDGDPVVPADLADAYLAPLIEHLRQVNRHGLFAEFVEEAAGDAIISLIKNPASLDPSRSTVSLPLQAYLRRAAQCDLQNRVKKEQRHQRGRVSLESVEQLPSGGKYLSRDDDPSLALQSREDRAAIDSQILPEIRAGLSEGEGRCLELLLQGERKTLAFAQALGIDHLSKQEQKVQVKQTKDKLKIRLKRRNHGGAS